MLINYLTTFVRILLRQKIYSFINVFGLAIGIAATLLIALYITDELSYDKFHKDADRIYRIATYWKWNETDGPDAYSAGTLLEEIQKNISGIESVAHMEFWKPIAVRFNDRIMMDDKTIVASPNFFDFFDFKLLSGDPKTVLKNTNSIIITKSAAQKYFGLDSKEAYLAIGKTLLLGQDKLATTVTGVAEDVPENSHFHFNIVLSTVGRVKHKPGDFGGYYTYIKLNSGVEIGSLKKPLARLCKTLMEPTLAQFMHQTFDEFEAKGNRIYFLPQPLTSIHLNSHADHEIEQNGDMQSLYLKGLVALIITTLACVNFVNLSTARAITRAKEIGIRKAVGAFHSRIVNQHLLESYLYTTLAFVLALGMISLVLTPFNILTTKTFTITSLSIWQNMVIALILFLIIGLLSGTYPAFYLTRFKPSEVLKGKLNNLGGGSNLRSELVMAQFTISITLIISSLLIYRQINFMLARDPGFEKENVLYNMNVHSLNGNKNAFVNELQNHKEILSCSFISDLPTDINYISLNVIGSQRWIDFCFFRGDPNLARTLDLKFKYGRGFSSDYLSDSSTAIINETAANILGITKLTNEYILVKAPGSKYETKFRVIGVINDINFQSLKFQVKPMIIFPGGGPKTLIKLTAGDTREKVDLIKSIWKKYSDTPFEFEFLDSKYATLYKNEIQLGQVAFVFSFLAILIASLGLLGLVTYVASQRTKEIGIRKIMGASIAQIVVLLSKDFLRLVTIAFFIAVPISWYGMNEWLNDFAYRIDFSFVVAGITGCAVVLIALLTVSLQSIKASMGNPVESLKSE